MTFFGKDQRASSSDAPQIHAAGTDIAWVSNLTMADDAWIVLGQRGVIRGAVQIRFVRSA